MSYYRRRVKPPTESQKLYCDARTSATAFVNSKFRTLTPAEFDAFASWYYSQHGGGAYNYLLRTYSLWKRGVVGMSSQTWFRILAGVPRVMSRTEQFRLLRFYLPYLLSRPREEFENSTVDSARLSEVYAAAAQAIIKATLDLDWFVSAVFFEEQICTLQNIVRYIILTRLDASFSDVRSDLIDLHNAIARVDADVTVSYRITFLGAQVAVSTIPALAGQSFAVTCPPLTHEDANDVELKAILADYTLTDALNTTLRVESTLLRFTTSKTSLSNSTPHDITRNGSPT
jgi:hypothetical protein